MVLGKIIGTIIFAGSSIEENLALTNAIFNPKETHIHCSSTVLLDGVGKNTDGTLVIDPDRSSGRGMFHFDQCVANSETLFADGKYRRNFSFGGGRHDVQKNLVENMNGTIPRRRWVVIRG